MAETMTRNTERTPEAREMVEVGEVLRVNLDGQDCAVFIPEGKGIECDGAEMFDVEIFPWSLFEQARILLERYKEFDGIENPDGYSGFLRSLREWIGGKISAMALFTALGVSACDTANHDDPTDQSPKLTQRQGALSMTDQFGTPKLQAWSQFGDTQVQLGEVGGKKVVVFTRYIDGVGYEFFYVDCDTFEKCFDVQEAKILKGVENVGSAGGAGMPLIVGNDFYFRRGGESKGKDRKGTLGFIPYLSKSGQTEMVLNVDSIQEVPEVLSTADSLVYEMADGVKTPFLYGGNEGINLLNEGYGPGKSDDVIPKVNLLSPEQAISVPYAFDSCGAPHRPGVNGSWMRSIAVNYPNTVCRLIKADSFEALSNFPLNFIKDSNGKDINLMPGGKHKFHQRISEPDPVTGKSVMFYLSGNDTYTTRVYGLMITPIPANPDPQPEPNPEPDTTDGGGTGTETDASAVELPQNPEPDAEVATEVEATGGEIDGVLDSTTDDGDATGILDETGNGSTDIATDEATQLPDNGAQELPPQDNGPDIKETIDPCQSIASKMKMTQDKCGLENCKDLTADLTGSCTIEVNMGDKQPMILHIDGKFSIDMFEKMGQLLQGQYKVVDNGNNFNVAYETLVTGVTGTTYEGKEAMTDSGPGKVVEKGYYIKCDEGSIDLYLLDGKGGKTKIATLKAGEDGTFTLNGQKVVKDTDAGNDALPPTDAGNETLPSEDTEKDNGQNPQTDASSTPPETSSTNPEPSFDAGQSGQEAAQPEQPQATQPETTTSQPPSSPPKDGCSISSTSPTSPESQSSAFAQLGILLSAAALLLKRKMRKG